MNDALPHDPALPHLATALDADALAHVFAGMLARPVERCRIDRIKYRPRRNASVSYALTLRDGEGGAFEQAVATRWCQGGEAARRYAHALQRPSRPSAAGPSWSHQPDLDFFAAWAPNDPKLDALAELLDAERLRTRWLPEVLAAAGVAHMRSHTTQIVQWVPEHRVCARVAVQLGDGRALTLYAKADSEHAVAATYAVLQALHANPRLSTARPVVCQPGAGLYWQQAIDGQPLASLGSAFGPAHAARVGELLAALHATAVPTTMARCVTADSLHRERHHAARLVATILPAWQPTLDRLLASLDGGDGAIGALAPCTLHGDLHRGNLLATESGLALIDLDSVQRGPAVLELGSWIADSMYLALLAGQAPEAATRQWRELLRAYAAAGGTPADEALLAWATAHQLLCERAYRCVANLKPGRFALASALLLLADAIAEARSLDAAPLPQVA